MVSVAVPSYNHARFLPQCIESVLSQTKGDLELLIVDDGSRDESVSIAKGYSDPRVKVFENPQNLGTYGTQNRALDLATGEWIAILNSDDWWEPTKLERQLQALADESGVEACYTRGTVIDEEGFPKDLNHHADFPTQVRQSLLPWLFHENRVLASSLLFRRGSVRFREELKFCGDWAALLDLCSRGQIAFVDEPLVAWRHHGENTSSKLQSLAPEEIRVRRAILDTYGAQPWPEPGREKLARCALSLNALLLLAGDKRAALEAAKLAVRLDPSNSTAAKRVRLGWVPLGIQQRWVWPGTDPRPVCRAYRSGASETLRLSAPARP